MPTQLRTLHHLTSLVTLTSSRSHGSLAVPIDHKLAARVLLGDDLLAALILAEEAVDGVPAALAAQGVGHAGQDLGEVVGAGAIGLIILVGVKCII